MKLWAGRARSFSIAVEVPLSVVERADGASLEPAGDAMEVEGVIADAPGLVALLGRVGHLVGLAVDARLHDVVPADGAVVDVDVPGPESHCVPLFHFEALLRRGSFHHLSSRFLG